LLSSIFFSNTSNYFPSYSNLVLFDSINFIIVVDLPAFKHNLRISISALTYNLSLFNDYCIFKLITIFLCNYHFFRVVVVFPISSSDVDNDFYSLRAVSIFMNPLFKITAPHIAPIPTIISVTLLFNSSLLFRLVLKSVFFSFSFMISLKKSTV
jgi:hypothetical protein